MNVATHELGREKMNNGPIFKPISAIFTFSRKEHQRSDIFLGKAKHPLSSKLAKSKLNHPN